MNNGVAILVRRLQLTQEYRKLQVIYLAHICANRACSNDKAEYFDVRAYA